MCRDASATTVKVKLGVNNKTKCTRNIVIFLNK